MHKIQLTLTPSGIGSKIVIDGEEVDGCSVITVRAAVGEATSVTLEFPASKVCADITTLQDSVRRFQAEIAGITGG